MGLFMTSKEFYVSLLRNMGLFCFHYKNTYMIIIIQTNAENILDFFMCWV